MTLAEKAADQIMALVDEFPSEPFSFERKRVLDLITQLIYRHTQEAEDQLDEGFAVGVDEGRRQAEEEAEDRISELEEEIELLKEDLKDEYQRGYDEGFDTASATSS